MAKDARNEVLTLLSNSWTASNTDNVTPQFSPVEDKKRIDFGKYPDWVLAQVHRPLKEPAGIGDQRKHVFDRFDLDIRVYGADKQAHFLKVCDEVESILDDNLVYNTNGFTEISSDGDQRNMSDGTRGLWRMLIPVNVKRYNVSR